MLKKKNVLKFILGLKIRQLRARRELSLKDLADRSELSSSYLNEIENGKKYPKIEKLAAIARGLNVGLEELVSFKTGRNLHPLLKFLEGDFVSKVPLELFGLNESDVSDLMGKDPEKFASFVLTVLQLSRSFDMKLEDLYAASLKSYIEVNDNYFPEMEKLAKEMRNKLNPEGHPIDYDSLVCFIHDRFHVEVDSVSLITDARLNDVNFYHKRSGQQKIYLNSNLHNNQRKFYLAKALGLMLLNPESAQDNLSSRLMDFKTSYFANSLLIEEKQFARDVKHLFNKSTFDSEFFQMMLDKYEVSPELMFHRLTQILPSSFKIREIFFLGMTLDVMTQQVVMNKELHLSQLHRPHGVRMNESYCRRWVATKSLEEFIKQAPEKSTDFKVVLSQISKVEDGTEYFSVSLAKRSQMKNNIIQSLTIGFLMNEDLKNSVKFLNDGNLKRVAIGQTCQRCSQENCGERIAEASIYKAQIERSFKESLLNDL